MLLLLFFIGFISTVIAAAPPGAANVAVIQASLQQQRTTRKIIIGAGLGEVLVAFIALQYTMKLAAFFETNPWVQILTFSLFVLIGLYLINRDRVTITTRKKTISFLKQSGMLKGFLLAGINPPVLLFWVLALGVYHYITIEISAMSTALQLFLFFSGIFLGKILVLAGYAHLGKKQNQQKNQNKSKLYKGIGTALMILGIVQAVKFVAF